MFDLEQYCLDLYAAQNPRQPKAAVHIRERTLTNNQDYEEVRVVTKPDIYNDVDYNTNYHQHSEEPQHHLLQQQSLVGEVTPSKIEKNIVSLSTDKDADGEKKRTD